MTLSRDEYLTITHPVKTEIKVKGSRFMASLFPVTTKEQAESMYQEIRKKYYNATHNCFAYRIDSDLFRYSDDGEPSGTAGKPILRVIDGQRIYEALCVITRYFGGTKLGTGGLIRAYSQAAQQAFSEARIKTCIRRSVIDISLTYEHENITRVLLNRYKGIIEKADYGKTIKMKVAIPESLCEQFIREIEEQTYLAVKPRG